MKKFLFWCSFPFMFILYIVFGCIQAVCELINNRLHKFEAWCFNYNKHHVYLGDGIWRGKRPEEYTEHTDL